MPRHGPHEPRGLAGAGRVLRRRLVHALAAPGSGGRPCPAVRPDRGGRARRALRRELERFHPPAQAPVLARRPAGAAGRPLPRRESAGAPGRGARGPLVPRRGPLLQGTSRVGLRRSLRVRALAVLLLPLAHAPDARLRLADPARDPRRELGLRPSRAPPRLAPLRAGAPGRARGWLPQRLLRRALRAVPGARGPRPVAGAASRTAGARRSGARPAAAPDRGRRQRQPPAAARAPGAGRHRAPALRQPRAIRAQAARARAADRGQRPRALAGGRTGVRARRARQGRAGLRLPGPRRSRRLARARGHERSPGARAPRRCPPPPSRSRGRSLTPWSAA